MQMLPHRITFYSAIFKSGGTLTARFQSESESCSPLSAPGRAAPRCHSSRIPPLPHQHRGLPGAPQARELLTTAPPPAPPGMGPFCVESAMAAPAGREAPQFVAHGRSQPPPPELPLPARPRPTAIPTPGTEHAPADPHSRMRPDATSRGPRGCRAM